MAKSKSPRVQLCALANRKKFVATDTLTLAFGMLISLSLVQVALSVGSSQREHRRFSISFDAERSVCDQSRVSNLLCQPCATVYPHFAVIL
jgi:hypothetical protein